MRNYYSIFIYVYHLFILRMKRNIFKKFIFFIEHQYTSYSTFLLNNKLLYSCSWFIIYLYREFIFSSANIIVASLSFIYIMKSFLIQLIQQVDYLFYF